MSVLPVIIRELRAQARQPLTYWLRMVGGLSLVCALVFALWTTSAGGVWMGTATRAFAQAGYAMPNPLQSFGIALFGKLNLFIFGSIWLFVPLAAADAVSRERREGTLVLLYLTELRSLGIVVGKAFVHMLRSLSLFLVMAPWLVLPVLFGGVEWRDIWMALLFDFASVLLAIAAGLLASTLPRDWLKSVLLAELFAVLFMVWLLNVHGIVLGQAFAAGVPSGTAPWRGGLRSRLVYNFQEFVPDHRDGGRLARTGRLLEVITDGSFRERDYFWYGGFGVTRQYQSDWQLIWASLTPAGHAVWLRGALGVVVGAALMLVVAALLGAWRVASSWHAPPQESAVLELRRAFLVPRFAVPLLRRNLSRTLTANPIGWLQHYSPSARLVKWAWCLFIIAVEISLSGNPDDLYGAQRGLGLLLLLGLTFSATASFREELETGAFELLLVTPLRERQLIAGRVRGLWRQFLPAVLVYGAGSIYLASGWSERAIAREAWLSLATTLSGFCALPLIGLYFSVRRWNFFVAWLAACVLGLLPASLGRMLGARESSMWLLQLATAATMVLLLERRLRNREFLRLSG